MLRPLNKSLPFLILAKPPDSFMLLTPWTSCLTLSPAEIIVPTPQGCWGSLKPVGKVLGIVKALQRVAVPCGLLAGFSGAEREQLLPAVSKGGLQRLIPGLPEACRGLVPFLFLQAPGTFKNEEIPQQDYPNGGRFETLKLNKPMTLTHMKRSQTSLSSC